MYFSMDSVEMQANNINMSVGKCKATLKQNKKMEFLFIFFRNYQISPTFDMFWLLVLTCNCFRKTQSIQPNQVTVYFLRNIVFVLSHEIKCRVVLLFYVFYGEGCQRTKLMTTSCCSVSILLKEKLGKVTMGFGDSFLNSAGLDLYCIRRLTLFESFNFLAHQKYV